MATRDFIRRTESSRACMNQRKARLNAPRMVAPRVADAPAPKSKAPKSKTAKTSKKKRI